MDQSPGRDSLALNRVPLVDCERLFAVVSAKPEKPAQDEIRNQAGIWATERGKNSRPNSEMSRPSESDRLPAADVRHKLS